MTQPHVMFKYLIPFVLAGLTWAQAPAPAKPQTAAPRKASSASSSPVDNVISLVKAGLSESLVIKSLQKANKPYTPSTAEL